MAKKRKHSSPRQVQITPEKAAEKKIPQVQRTKEGTVEESTEEAAP